MTKTEYTTVWNEYQSGVQFKNQIGLYDTVTNNENFYLGRQWEGVTSNGLPTPVVNILKRIVSHQVASVVSDNIKMNATPLAGITSLPPKQMAAIADACAERFVALFEQNKIGNLIRQYVRNASVDGDGCLYTYFDPDIQTGNIPGGDIVTEIVENTRVVFGNANDSRVQKQPWVILARRQPVEEVRERAKENGGEPDNVKSDSDDANNWHEGLTDDRCTVALKFRKDRKTKHIFAYECTASAIVRPEWDTGLTLYPITWFSIDYIQNCYHGQATITGLIDNQIFINKMLAGAMLSLMTTAYPKVLYDKTRIPKWDNRIGSAIPLQSGGDVNSAAKIMDPAQIDPQVAQFIQMVIAMTKDACGATEASLGEAKAYNTSALISQQRAAAVPHEMMRRNLYETVEDLGRIYIDHMAAYYGERPTGFVQQDGMPVVFDYSLLRKIPMSLKLDVGAASYWSEISSLQTMDNLLMQQKINIVQYLERIPDEYVPKKRELVDEIKQLMAAQPPVPPLDAGGAEQPSLDQNQPPEIPTTRGNSELQRSVNETGVVQ